MALSVSSKQTSNIPLSDVYLKVLTISFAGVTSGVLATADHGFQNIVGAWFVNNTTEDLGLLKINSNGSTTVRGSISIAQVTSNDIGQLFILGN